MTDARTLTAREARLLDRATSLYPRVAQGALPAGQLAELKSLIDGLLASPKPVERKISYCPLSIVSAGEERGLVNRLLAIFSATPGYAIARKILGRHPLFLMHHCIVRRRDLSDPADTSPWHVDADFMGATGEMLNIWMPLVDVGRAHPGLSFLVSPEAVRAVWHAWCAWADSPEIRARSGWQHSPVSDPAWLARIVGGDPDALARTPEMRAGDAVVFNQCIPHRTQAMAAPATARYSIEFRLADPDDLPQSYRDRNLSVAVPEMTDAGLSLRGTTSHAL